QRDGEVDEIFLAAPEQHELGGADGAQLPPSEERHDQGEAGDGTRPDRDPLGGGEAHALPEREDDLVLGRVVRRGRLAGYRLDVELDRRRQAEQAVDVNVRESHGISLSGVDDGDLFMVRDWFVRFYDIVLC